jgi:hypothetical protein
LQDTRTGRNTRHGLGFPAPTTRPDRLTGVISPAGALAIGLKTRETRTLGNRILLGLLNVNNVLITPCLRRVVRLACDPLREDSEVLNRGTGSPRRGAPQ